MKEFILNLLFKITLIRKPYIFHLDFGIARNRLTGWIQWTFTKCSVEFYHSVHEEYTRLLMQIEDSIISLEFDNVFHKLKTKLASFGMYHQSR